jgi:hypothetical protein
MQFAKAEECVAKAWKATGTNKLAFMIVGQEALILLQELVYPGAQGKVLEFPSAYSCSPRPDYFNPASKVLHAVGLPASKDVVYDAQLFHPPEDERTIVVCYRFEQARFTWAPRGHRWYTSVEIQKLMESGSSTTVVSPVVNAAMVTWQELIASLQPQPEESGEVVALPPVKSLAKSAAKPRPSRSRSVTTVAVVAGQ